MWLSLVALSRLQHLVTNDINTDMKKSEKVIDRQLLDDLSYYCNFANAAYGWKGCFMCGRLPMGGNDQVLISCTGIDKSDLVMTSWHEKANQPVSHHCSDPHLSHHQLSFYTVSTM